MFACFAEAMLLDLEGWHTNFSWGRNNIQVERMEQIGRASLRHGFRALDLHSQATSAEASLDTTTPRTADALAAG
jgi:fatty aldehyde-generating acyl-ACP reductase